MFFARTPPLVKLLYPGRIWNMDREERTVYLTFDDGPIPQLTPWVLEQLVANNAKATFFCIGKNADKDQVILKKIIEAGHTIGNHSWSHLRGTRTPTAAYVKDVLRADTALGLIVGETAKPLFRPPYGRITNDQVRELKNRYRVVMWDVLSGDFDTRTTPEQCLKNVIRNIRSGSIVVFHDSLKAEERLRYALPLTLEFLRKEGYTMKAIR
ncbi:MAG: polysaccharide deacetylase family protein [Flavobacteriales bacterium]|nr:polysaccharide deacetylase family protein [Flavobacteriales bacterium]